MESRLLGIIYEWKLVRVPLSDPLIGTRYIGQSVRPQHCYQCPDKLLRKRCSEHVGKSRYEPKELGLHAAIERYGVDAFDVSVVDFQRGSAETYAWANQLERYWIKEYGGPLQDMDPETPIVQTFNLTHGGTGVCEVARVAASNGRMKTLVIRLKTYVDEFPERGANVPTVYVCPDGYTLGENIHHVRKRRFLDPKWISVLESLPNWTWNGKQASEFKDLFRKRVDAGIARAGGQSVVTKKQHENPERLVKYRKTRRSNVIAKRERQREALPPEKRAAFDKQCARYDRAIAKRRAKRESKVDGV